MHAYMHVCMFVYSQPMGFGGLVTLLVRTCGIHICLHACMHAVLNDYISLGMHALRLSYGHVMQRC